MNTHAPKSIGEAIAATLEELGFGKRVKQYKVLELWERVVGEQIATVTTAERINDGVLFVSVHGAPWRNELIFLKKELIGKLNEAMNEETVKDIIFR